MGMEEEYELKSEIENVKKQYAIIKDYLSGAEYDVNTVKGCLHEIKDSLSRIRFLFYSYTSKQGKPVDLPTRDIVDAIDLALLLMESRPTKARVALQLSFTLSKVKIEEMMAWLDILSRFI